ncbi:14474_t:CDS:2, partial [Racocetra fulgida]
LKTIVILGTPKVGKTSLFRQIVNQHSLVGDRKLAKISPIVNYTESLIKIEENFYKLIDTPPLLLRPHAEIEKAREKQIEELLKKIEEDTKKEKLNLLIFGPPNSGKSTLMNYLLQENRSLATPLAGTTQEPIFQIINLGEKYHKPLFIIVNKCDLLPDQRLIISELRNRLKSLGYCPVICLSVLKGTGFSSLAESLNKISQAIEQMIAANSPLYHRGNKLKIYFARQEAAEEKIIADLKLELEEKSNHYIFCYCHLTPKLIRFLTKTTGIISFLNYKKNDLRLPNPVSPEVIKKLFSVPLPKNLTPFQPADLNVGDLVLIKEGNFSNCEGRITYSSEKKVKIDLDFLGRKISLDALPENCQKLLI